MAHSRNASPLHKTHQTSIHPSDRLDITLNLQKGAADDRWLPGMSVFSVNGSPFVDSQTGVQPEATSTGDSMPTGLPIRPRVAPDYCMQVHGRTSSSKISPDIVVAYMRQSGASEESISRAYASPALLDYHCQIMLLHQQNRQEGRTQLPALNSAFPPTHHTPSAYIAQLSLLAEETKKRVRMAGREQDRVSAIRTGLPLTSNERQIKREALSEPKSAYDVQQQLNAMNQKKDEPLGSDRREVVPLLGRTLGDDHTNQEFRSHLSDPYLYSTEAPTRFTGSYEQEPSSNTSTGQSSGSYHPPAHQLWLSGPHALQDFETQRKLIEQQRTSQNSALPSHALEDYQMQLQLLEQQNKRRKMRQDAAKAKEDAELAHKRCKSYLKAHDQGFQLGAEHAQPDSPAERCEPAASGQQDITVNNSTAQLLENFCPMCRQRKTNGDDGHPICRNCFYRDLSGRESTQNRIGFVEKPNSDRPVPDQRYRCGFSLINNVPPPVQVRAQEISAQQQAVIQRHQNNMDAWQKIQQQQNDSNMSLAGDHSQLPPYFGAKHSSSRIDNRKQWSWDTSGFPQDVSRPTENGVAEEHFVVDLPMRPSKQVAEQTEPEMEEWAEVERPQERACSEESEQFTEDFNHDFTSF